MSKIKTYEVVGQLERHGLEVPIGTHLALHDNEAKYIKSRLRLLNSERVAEAENTAEVAVQEADAADPRAEALLPLIDRRARTRRG
jgi:hypothetical protein